MHYVAYLDEFGHVGQYVSRNHSQYKTSPVFGLGGMLIPAHHVREFAIYFYKLKCHLLAWDLQHKNPRQLPPYQWEKKGASIYTPTNIAKYQSLRHSTFRLLNQIKQVGGHVFYTGEHKTAAPHVQDSDRASSPRRKPPFPDTPMRRLDMWPHWPPHGAICCTRRVSRRGGLQEVLFLSHRRCLYPMQRSGTSEKCQTARSS
ncbi:DUF3800 domain-containing protein [Pseudomonas gingeri]|uniref:DUF3800 domain-containing protein n=1 Tax=Pseudomonas gingeri TaxID=117681 RepID=UPI0035299B52